MGAGTPENGFWPGATTPDLCLVSQGMNATSHTVNESDGTTHGIDEDRYVRAVREDMDVACLGPAAYEVVHGGETYGVDLDGVHCTCPDHEYRDARCKHLVRAALFAAFTDGVRSRFIAAVVRASIDFGCVDGHAGCAGPTGDTLPCQTCIHGTGTGEWTVWAVLVNGRPAREVTPDATVDRGEGIATDGGRELTGDHPLDGRCGECGARYTVDETVTNECPKCGYSAFEPAATDGGTVETTDAGTEPEPEPTNLHRDKRPRVHGHGPRVQRNADGSIQKIEIAVKSGAHGNYKLTLTYYAIEGVAHVEQMENDDSRESTIGRRHFRMLALADDVVSHVPGVETVTRFEDEIAETRETYERDLRERLAAAVAACT